MTLDIQTNNNITAITLNRPDKNNAFDERLIGDLMSAFETVQNDHTVRAVVLRGKGRHFCAGGDLDWMRRAASFTREDNIADAAQLGRLLKLINTLNKPVIALVQGAAYGGGVGLAACADIVIAEESAVFCLSEVRIGLIPSIIAPYVVAAIGGRQARRYFMTAERITASVAKDIGLAHEVVPDGQLDAGLENILSALGDGAPGAQARGKGLIAEITGQAIEDALITRTVEIIADARASEEGKDGVSAFLEKRKPSWQKD